MRTQDGPSLPLGRKLCWPEKLQILLSFYSVRCHRLHYIHDYKSVQKPSFCVLCLRLHLSANFSPDFLFLSPSKIFMAVVRSVGDIFSRGSGGSNGSHDQSTIAIGSLLATVLTGAFGFSLMFFLCFHLSLILSGQTTLEKSTGLGRLRERRSRRVKFS